MPAGRWGRVVTVSEVVDNREVIDVEKTAGKKGIWFSNGMVMEQERVNCKYKAKNARDNCRKIIATYTLYVKGRGGWVFNR